MALDSRTKTMIVASITAAAMVVSSLVIWKQVFFGKRTAPETAAVAQRPPQEEPGAPASQPAAPGQLSAPAGGAILAPVTPKQPPAAAQTVKSDEKTLDQIFSERQPVASPSPAAQGAAPPASPQSATPPATAQSASQPQPPQPAQPSAPPAVSPAPSGQQTPVKPEPRPAATASAQPQAEPAQAEPQYQPVEIDSTAAAKSEQKTYAPENDPERAALESSLEKEALGLTTPSREKGQGKKAAPEAKGKKTAPKAAATATAEAQTPAAKAEPQVQTPAAKAQAPAGTGEHQRARPAPGAAWKGQGVFKTASVSASGDTTTVRISATAVPPNHEVIAADSPARLIIDLPGHWEHEGPGEVAGAGVVRKVRIGKHADKLRIVLDLTVDSTAKLSGKPTIEATGEGLTITLKK
jgi:hypothetical protein